MTKRTRNKLGQLEFSNLTDAKTEIVFPEGTQMIFKLIMVLFLLFMASPWLTLWLKSKKIQRLLYLIIDFCDTHFMFEDGNNRVSKETKNGDDI